MTKSANKLSWIVKTLKLGDLGAQRKKKLGLVPAPPLFPSLLSKFLIPQTQITFSYTPTFQVKILYPPLLEKMCCPPIFPKSLLPPHQKQNKKTKGTPPPWGVFCTFPKSWKNGLRTD